jgi:hypothetical protein
LILNQELDLKLIVWEYLQEREGASQAVFARYLNVTTGLISQSAGARGEASAGDVGQVAFPCRQERVRDGRIIAAANKVSDEEANKSAV